MLPKNVYGMDFQNLEKHDDSFGLDLLSPVTSKQPRDDFTDFG